jgi:putative membrane protein
MWGNDYNMMGGSWGWFAGAGVLFLVVIAVIVVYRMIPSRVTQPVALIHPSPSAPAGSPQTPRQILDERYAKGDLTTDEYRERLKNLGSA